jgi:hypothetical protein
MIRGGVPQSVALRVTGHRSDSMFRRYDIASLDDKLDALRRAREYAATRAAVAKTSLRFRGICRRNCQRTRKRPKFPKEIGWEAGT